MKDMITKGTGNSRFLKSSIPGGTTWDQALTMLRSGTFPIDLNGLNSAGIIQQGSAYSKVNVLPDDVCTALGLDPTAAEPKDAFGVVANPAELWVWEKTLYTPQSYELGEVIERVVLTADSHYANGSYYEYADAIHVNKNGRIELINPTGVTVTYNNNYASVLLGKYIKTFSSTPDNKLSANAVYYIPADCSLNSSKNVVANGNTYTYGVTASKVQRVIGADEIITHVSYLASPDSEAYLEDGQSGDYWYTRLGQIGDGMTKHEIGSYVGTGTYGESTPNSLTFEFVPKAFLITVPTGGYYAYPSPNPVLFIMGADTISLDGFAGNQNDTITVIWNGKTVSWYSTQENPQLNRAGATYHYVVFG